MGKPMGPGWWWIFAGGRFGACCAEGVRGGGRTVDTCPWEGPKGELRPQRA